MRIPTVMFSAGAVLVVCCITVTLGATTSMSFHGHPSCEHHFPVECFAREGIDYKFPIPEATSSQDPPASLSPWLDFMGRNESRIWTMCHERDRYQRAMMCLYEAEQSCIPPDFRDSFPSPSVVPLVLDDLCSHLPHIDQACYVSKYSASLDCARRKGNEFAQQLLQGTVNMTGYENNYILCASLRLAAECVRETLPPCGCVTTSTFLRVIKQYQNPPACPPIDVPAPVCDIEDEPATEGDAVQHGDAFALPQTSCNLNGIAQCYANEGIVQPGSPSFDAQQQQQQSVLNDLLNSGSTSVATTMMCQPDELPRYQRAFVCAMNAAKACAPPGHEDLLPDATRMQGAISFVCDHYQHLNMPCYQSHSSRIFACGQRKAHELANQYISSGEPLEPSTLVCSGFKAAAECYKEVLAPCGCMTSYTFVEITKRFLSSATCHIDVATPVCDPNTFQFISGGGAAGLKQLKAWSLAVSLLVGYAVVVVLGI